MTSTAATTASNFCLPVTTLESSRVKLVPFEADQHAAAFFDLSDGHPELYAHMGFGPFSNRDDFVTKFIANHAVADRTMLTYAVIDKTKLDLGSHPNGVVAGMASYIHTSLVNLATEIGSIVILPPFHRTHVTTNAVGLMINHALKATAEGGLGLRRVVWQTSTMNVPSLRVAERMGFRQEAVLRWDRLFAKGKLRSKVGNGRELPPGSDDDDLWRDTVVLAMCWDDWSQGVDERVKAAIDRAC